MFSKVQSAALNGLDAYLVRVEADISDGMPQLLMVGYLSSEVREAGDRVRTAMRNTGILLPPKRITVNLAPAGIRKAGSRFDLPVAAAILASLEKIPGESLNNVMLTGELSLSGQVLPVSGILSLVEAARDSGIRRCIVPARNAAEGAVLDGMEIVGVSSLGQLIEVLRHPEKAVRELWRVTAPGGRLILPTYLQGKTGASYGTLIKIYQGIGFHYEYAFTPETYRAFLENLRLATLQLEVISGHVPEGIAILEKLC